MDDTPREMTNRKTFTAYEAICHASIAPNIEYVMQQLMVKPKFILTPKETSTYTVPSQSTRLIRLFTLWVKSFQSKLLTHYLAPIPRNKTFAAFDNTMEELRQRYSSGSRSSERTLTLTGVACGAKSQAAIECCLRSQNHQQFGAIFWVKASSVKAIEKSFRAIAVKLNVAGNDPVETKIKTTLSILAAWPCPWLIVLDNYRGNDMSKDLANYMPESGHGSYIIPRKLDDLTSEERNSAIYFPNLQLLDALDLLFNRSAVE